MHRATLQAVALVVLSLVMGCGRKPPPIVEVKPPPPATVPVAPPPVTPPPAPAPEVSHTGTVVGWCLIGAGLIADGVAAYEGYRAKQTADQLGRDSMNGLVFDPSLETEGKNANIAAIALAIGGTAVAVAGAIILISSGGSSSDQPEKPATPVARLSLTPWISTGLIGGGARLQF